MTNEVDIQLIMLNDVYEYVSKNRVGGMAEAAGLINRIRKPDTASFVTVSGDFIGGSSWGVFEGKPMVEIFNEMKVDAVAIGNHDFDYGPEVTLQRMGESKFSWLGANVFDTKTGNLFGNLIDVQMKTVKSKDGEDEIDFGFFGLCTETTPVVSRPGDDIEFRNIIEVAKAACKKLQGMGADVIIAVTHLELNEDMELAKEVQEINLILGGHEHTPFGQMQGDTLIYKCGQNAHLVGFVDLKVFIDEDDDLTIVPSWNTVANFAETPDPGVKRIVDDYAAQKAKIDANLDLDEVMATVIEQPLSSKTNEIRVGTSAFGALVADSFADFYQTNPPLGIMNAGGIRGDALYEVGTGITRKIVRENEMRFGDVLYLIKIKGKYIKNGLEQMLELAPDPTGSFPQLSSGFKVIYDVSESPAYRIHTLEIGGVPVEAEKEYEIVTSTFIYEGGDGVTAWSNGEVEEHVDEDCREVFCAYLKRQYPNGVSGKIPEDRIKEGKPGGAQATAPPEDEDMTDVPEGKEVPSGDAEAGTKRAQRPGGKRKKKKKRIKAAGKIDIWKGPKGRALKNRYNANKRKRMAVANGQLRPTGTT